MFHLLLLILVLTLLGMVNQTEAVQIKAEATAPPNFGA